MLPGLVHVLTGGNSIREANRWSKLYSLNFLASRFDALLSSESKHQMTSPKALQHPLTKFSDISVARPTNERTCSGISSSILSLLCEAGCAVRMASLSDAVSQMNSIAFSIPMASPSSGKPFNSSCNWLNVAIYVSRLEVDLRRLRDDEQYRVATGIVL